MNLREIHLWDSLGLNLSREAGSDRGLEAKRYSDLGATDSADDLSAYMPHK